jgi:magnesium transporter
MQDFLRVIWKESRVALSVGTILALVNAARIYVMYRDEAMALVIGITLIGTVLLSKLLGCMLPMLAKRLKLDPALMAAPLITTIVDTCSVLLYFNIALRVMKL